MPVDIFHDPILRQKPHGSGRFLPHKNFNRLLGRRTLVVRVDNIAIAIAESPEASNDTSSTTSPLDFRILHSQLQDLDLADILRDALCDFNVRYERKQSTVKPY
jgi:hypothetical protein